MDLIILELGGSKIEVDVDSDASVASALARIGSVMGSPVLGVTIGEYGPYALYASPDPNIQSEGLAGDFANFVKTLAHPGEHLPVALVAARGSAPVALSAARFSGADPRAEEGDGDCGIVAASPRSGVLPPFEFSED